MIPYYWIFIAIIVVFMLGFIIGWYNYQVMSSRTDKTRHSIGLGLGITMMFIAMLMAAAGPIITKHFEPESANTTTFNT